MKDDSVYIDQILEAIEKIDLFVGSMGKESFLNDAKTQSAVMMQLIIIGEVSKKISEQTKTSTDIPWRDIAGFRDRAIHNYFGMDLEIVWVTVTDDLPSLYKALSN